MNRPPTVMGAARNCFGGLAMGARRPSYVAKLADRHRHEFGGGPDMRGLVVTADWDPKPGYHPTGDEVRRRRARLGSNVWRNPKYSIDDVPEPAALKPDQVLVETRAVGICGSDLHMLEGDDDGYMSLPSRISMPIAIGHEFSGVIVEVGCDVSSVEVGEPVAVEAITRCGDCRPCRMGYPVQCVHGEEHGFTLPGGTSQYVAVHESQCHSLRGLHNHFDEAAVYEAGALAEPTSIAYTGMFLTARGFRPGSHVVVFGCGAVGLAAIALARAAGAASIVAVDVVAERRSTALVLGATSTVDPGYGDAAQTVDAIMTETRGNGASMVVEATGVGTRVVPIAEDVLDLGGKLVLIGMEPGEVPFMTSKLQWRSASVYGTLGALGGYAPVIGLLSSGRLQSISELVGARFPLSDGVEAIERAQQKRDAKVIIHPAAS